MKVVVMKYFFKSENDAKSVLEFLGNGDGLSSEFKVYDIEGKIRNPTKKEKKEKLITELN